MAHLLGLGAFVAALLGTLALAVGILRGNAREKAKFRQQALAQLESWQCSAAAIQLQLAKDQCAVVHESESVGRVRNGPIYSYTLTRFLRNAAGDYFMVKSTPGGPYVKPVDDSVARVVLKEKYFGRGEA